LGAEKGKSLKKAGEIEKERKQNMGNFCFTAII